MNGILFAGIWWPKYAIKSDILGINNVSTNIQVSIIILNLCYTNITD